MRLRFPISEKCSPVPLVIGDFGDPLVAVRFEDREAMPRCLFARLRADDADL
jgi:hypothetical protein